MKIIDGHGFWDKGGVYTRGCLQKNFSAAFGGRKIFAPAPTPGGENFFSVGCLFSRPGGVFAQKRQKIASPGGQNFFSPGCFAPGGAPPPCFFHAGCRAIFDRKGGVHPPTVRWAARKVKIVFLHFWVLIVLTRWEIAIKNVFERFKGVKIAFLWS